MKYGTWCIVLVALAQLLHFGSWWWSVPNAYACSSPSHQESYLVRRPQAYDTLPKLPYRIEWVVMRSGSDRPFAYCEDRNMLSTTIVCSGDGLVMEIGKTSLGFIFGVERQRTSDGRAVVSLSGSGTCEKL